MASLKLFKKKLVVAMLFVLFMQIINVAKSQSGGVMGGESSSSSDFSSSFDAYYYNNPYKGHGGSAAKSSMDQDCYDEDNTLSDSGSLVLFLLFFALCCLVFVLATHDNMKRKTVLMLQIGLLDEGRYVQRDLNRIARSTRTDTLKGLTKILQETAKALLQHPGSWLYGFSSVDEMKSQEQMRQRFTELSNTERAKLDGECLVNFNGVKCRNRVVKKLQNNGEDYTVVTMILATQVSHKSWPAEDSKSIREALQSLCSLRVEENQGVQVTWSPQDENESMSEKQLKEKFPLLRPIDDVLNVRRNPSHMIKIG